jgi:hypothetical protein
LEEQDDFVILPAGPYAFIYVQDTLLEFGNTKVVEAVMDMPVKELAKITKNFVGIE